MAQVQILHFFYLVVNLEQGIGAAEVKVFWFGPASWPGPRTESQVATQPNLARVKQSPRTLACILACILPCILP
jgi:hypothetical protein